jgi:polyhydroxyalkanoate synthesis repressor PhaR
VSLTPDEQPPNHPGRPRLIKRYANRKLYDTRASRYVTLQQIAEYVRGGEEVSIIDNTTKEDLTNVTLAQILYEEERKHSSSNDEARKRSPTVRALRTLIQQSGERWMSTLREIAPASALGKLIRRDGPATSARSSEPDGPSAGEVSRPHLPLRPKDAWEELQRIADARVRAVLAAAIARLQELEGEVRRLQGRLIQMEQKVLAMRERSAKPGPASADGEVE